MLGRTERNRKVTVVEERTAGLPAAEIAKDKIGAVTESALASVAQTVGPALEDARLRLAPVAEQAIAQSKRQGRRATVRFRPVAEEPAESPKSHKLRNLVLMLGLGAIAAAVYKKMTGKDADPAWTAGRDTAAAAPGEPVVTSVNGGGTSAVDPIVAEPAGSDPLTTEPAAGSAGPIDGSETAPTAPFASEETVESSVPTTPDQPLEKRDFN